MEVNSPLSLFSLQAMLCMFSLMANLQVAKISVFLSWYFDLVKSYCFCLSIFSVNAGTAYAGLEEPRLTFSGNVKLRAGVNKISLLSIAVGLAVSSLKQFYFTKEITFIFSVLF